MVHHRAVQSLCPPSPSPGGNQCWSGEDVAGELTPWRFQQFNRAQTTKTYFLGRDAPMFYETWQ